MGWIECPRASHTNPVLAFGVLMSSPTQDIKKYYKKESKWFPFSAYIIGSLRYFLMSSGPDIHGLKVKALGRFTPQMGSVVDNIGAKKAPKKDIYDELSIELEGISELTHIDANKLLHAVKSREQGFGRLEEDYRRRILEKVDYAISSDMMGSLVGTMISLNMLKDIVFEAGGYEKALDFACERYGLTKEELSIKARTEDLSLVVVDDNVGLREAFRIITSFCGPKIAQDIFSLLMISKAGRLIAVRDSYGKMLGVIQVMYDKWGCSYIPLYSVLKSYRNTGVASMLLDAAEKHAKGRYVTATRSLDMVYNIASLLARGYTGRTFIPDWLGAHNPRVVFEKDLVAPHMPADYSREDVPAMESFSGECMLFSTHAGNTALIEEALNRRGYEIAGILPSSSGEMDKLVLRKAKDAGVFSSRGFDSKLPASASGYKFTLLEGYDEIYEAINLTEKTRIEEGEDNSSIGVHKNYPVLKIISSIGLLVGLRGADGRLAAFAGLLWDGADGICCHTLIAPGRSAQKPKLILLDYARQLAASAGRRRVWYVQSAMDTQSLRQVLNEGGFEATKEYLNPFHNRHNYLLLESPAPAAPSRARYEGTDIGRGKVLANFLDLKPADRDVFTPVGSYGYAELLLDAGFRLVAVLDGSSNGEPQEQYYYFKK
jgi:GNAT superfamily N-acetyltransferase